MKYLSQLMTSASGSINGVTGSHNKGGQYFRARTVPVNPNSPAQAAVRAALSSLTTAWGTILTEIQRTAWNDYAQVVPVTNSLGATVKLSGQQMFIRGNTPRMQAGLAVVYNGPVVMNRGSFTAVTAVCDSSTPSWDVTITIADDWNATADSAMLIYTSRAVSPGKQYFKGPYQLAGVIDDGETVALQTIPSPFPSMPDGQNGYLRARVTYGDGRLTDEQFLGPIVIDV
jgi:hypothetical protein